MAYLQGKLNPVCQVKSFDIRFFSWKRGYVGVLNTRLDRWGNARFYSKPIKSLSCCHLKKFQNLQKGVDNMAIREPPTFEEFMRMSWTEKRRVKEEKTDVYWGFIRKIQEREEKGNYWEDTKNVETISDNAVAEKNGS